MIQSENELQCFCCSLDAKVVASLIIAWDIINAVQVVSYAGVSAGIAFFFALPLAILFFLTCKGLYESRYQAFSNYYICIRGLINVLMIIGGAILAVYWSYHIPNDCYDSCPLYYLPIYGGILAVICGVVGLFLTRILAKSLEIVHSRNIRQAIPLTA
eukprot:TRINITY_DN3373_c0_g1_i1.p1 TRINITY_DN3373_c0_g1~~TRINITY_DN3373_c0_g1_i1.p1  ORF type:complete len:158 (-),score=40.30 TRINITY_DN3373_c0_g1_i1:85-558(-)